MSATVPPPNKEEEEADEDRSKNTNTISLGLFILTHKGARIYVNVII